jgi:hypothetical protein
MHASELDVKALHARDIRFLTVAADGSLETTTSSEHMNDHIVLNGTGHTT